MGTTGTGATMGRIGAANASLEVIIAEDEETSLSLTQHENSHRLSPHPATWRPPSSQQENDNRH